MSKARETASGFGRKNAVINGNFDIWQRKTSVTDPTSKTTSRTADRWYIRHIGLTGGSSTVSRETFTAGQTDVPNNPRYYFRFSRTGASSSGYIGQTVEDVRTFAGQTVTASCWAKSNITLNSIQFRLHQVFGSGGSAAVQTLGDTHILGTSWEFISDTVFLPSISGKTLGASNGINFELLINGTPDRIVDVAQFHLEQGSTATEFEYRPIGEELELCQRYYEKSYDIDTVPGTVTNVGMLEYRSNGVITNAPIIPTHRYSVWKRTSPTVTIYSPQTGTGGQLYNTTQAVDHASSSNSGNEGGFTVNWDAGAPATVDQDNVRAHWTAEAEF